MLRTGNSQRLSDNQRRVFCRMGFLLLVVLPTLLVLRMVLEESPRTKLLTALRTTTGLRATASRIETPRPGQYGLHDVTIDGGALGDIRLGPVRVVCGETCLVEVDETLRVDPQQLAALARQFCSTTLPTIPQQGANCRPILLSCKKMIVADRAQPLDPQRQMILGPVEMLFGTTDDRSVVEFRFQPAGQAGSVPTSIFIERHLGDGSPDRIRLETGPGQSLPVWMLESFWPAAERFGSAAQFAGRIELQAGSGKILEGTCAGDIWQIDLEKLGAGTALATRGNGQCSDFSCHLRDGRISSFQTDVIASLERLSPELVKACQQQGWQVSGPTQGPLEMQFRCGLEGGQLFFDPRPGNDGVILVNGTLQGVVRSGQQSIPRRQPLEQFAAELYPGRSQHVDFLCRFDLGNEPLTEAPLRRVADQDEFRGEKY